MNIKSTQLELIYFIHSLILLKADWLASEVGMKETEEDRIERYILTKFPDAKFTPVGKGGLKLDFGPGSKAEQKFNEVIVQADSSDEDTDTETDDEEDSETTSSDESNDDSSSDSSN